MGKSLARWALLVGVMFCLHAHAEDDENFETGRENPRNERRRPIPTQVNEEENTAVSTRPEASADLKRRLGPRAESKLFSWWSPETYRWSIGYDKVGSGVSPLGSDHLTFGMWFPGDFGMDFLVGYSKTAGTTNESRNVEETGTTIKTKVTTTTFTGATGANNIVGGLALKGRGYQNSWFQFNFGLLFAYALPSKTEGKVGSSIETIPDTNSPTTKTVQETANAGSGGFGTVTTDTKGIFYVGPRLGTEFYIKWFPHLALGFGTGVLVGFGGETTTTTTVRNRTTTFLNGVEQPNTTGTDGPETTTSTTTPGLRGGTFGVGGTQFQFTGIFSIRYIW